MVTNMGVVAAIIMVATKIMITTNRANSNNGHRRPNTKYDHKLTPMPKVKSIQICKFNLYFKLTLVLYIDSCSCVAAGILKLRIKRIRFVADRTSSKCCAVPLTKSFCSSKRSTSSFTLRSDHFFH